MKSPKLKLMIIVLVPLLVLSACDALIVYPEEQALQTQVAKEVIDAIVTQTMSAMEVIDGELVPVEEEPSLTPTDTATPTIAPTEAPTLTPTLTATATPSVPVVEVSVATNCRTGPGKIYDRVSVLTVGKAVEIVARNASGTYWVVKNPGGSGVCWLWDEYASVSGSTADLPIWEAPPTPTPQGGSTPTPTGVTLQVSVPTNCRVGPGKAYEIVSVLKTEKSVAVIARHATADYWVVENPEGSGYCWVWGEYASFTGSTAGLPVWEAPPTPTPTLVTLKVSVDTNCRTGPGKAYEIVTIFRIGKTAEVIARNAEQTYWVIENPDGSGYCWVWGEYATLTGPKAGLPVWDPPATPTPVK